VKSFARYSLRSIVDERLILNLKLSVYDARRQQIEAASRRAVDSRAISGEITIVAGTRENVFVGAPGNLAAFVRTDGRKHLVVFAGQYVNRMLRERLGPARNFFRDNFSRYWFAAANLSSWNYVDPLSAAR
jgi:hypothetical protein